MTEVVGRFAPSPTGQLHLGNLRTAMLAWLFARSESGGFLMRVEDLDPGRSHREIGLQQLRDLALLGLDWDGPIVRQSERRAMYRQAIEQLEAAGYIYRCYCTRREIAESTTAPHGPGGVPYPGTCRHLSKAETAAKRGEGRPAALRVRASGQMQFNDLLHGPISGELDDFVVRRNDGAPAYNLAVVVDDAAQNVTQVVRGDDLLPTTHRQVWLAQTLGVSVPGYVHVPLVHGPSNERLAKRDGATSLSDRIARGQSPDEVRSWLAESLGLATAGEQVSMGNLLGRFDPATVPRDPWIISGADL
ncbi:MAG: tRNA glutamyl-Q(34) synthetase GluQRS [Acidimicrobiales bacterium]